MLPLLGVTLMVLMGMGGVGVDVGYLEYRQQAQQVATDAAAAGGAEALLRAGCPNASAARTAGVADAASNGFANGNNNVTVSVSNPPASGPFSGNSCAVFVTIQTQQVPTFFTRLFSFQNGATETTQAAAIVSGSGTACIYLLSPTTQSDITNAHINGPGCGIVINDSANMSNSTIDMNSIAYAGPAPNVSGATFPEAAPAPSLPVADPCARIPGCNYLTNNPPSLTSCTAGNFNNATIPSGCYSSLTATGTDTMSTGLYVINGQFHLNNATVTSATGGVTIYMTANVQDTNFSNASLTLSPMSSGPTAGVLMYRVPSQSSAMDFSSAKSCNFGGLLYFPTTQVNYSNTGSQYSVLVFGSANFSTSQGNDFGPPPVGQSLINQAVVAE